MKNDMEFEKMYEMLVEGYKASGIKDKKAREEDRKLQADRLAKFKKTVKPEEKNSKLKEGFKDISEQLLSNVYEEMITESSRDFPEPPPPSNEKRSPNIEAQVYRWFKDIDLQRFLTKARTDIFYGMKNAKFHGYNKSDIHLAVEMLVKNIVSSIMPAEKDVKESFENTQMSDQPTQNPYKDLSISNLARMIKKDWKQVYFGAVPYLDAMFSMESVQDNYGMDSGRSIIAYFLSNSSAWRGPIAKQIKNELNRRFKGNK